MSVYILLACLTMMSKQVSPILHTTSSSFSFLTSSSSTGCVLYFNQDGTVLAPLGGNISLFIVAILDCIAKAIVGINVIYCWNVSTFPHCSSPFTNLVFSYLVLCSVLFCCLHCVVLCCVVLSCITLYCVVLYSVASY